MKTLTDSQPKCLVTVKGKTLLDSQIESLQQAGISEIAIVTGYKREQLTGRGLKEFHNERWENTNMVTSLCCADDWLKSGPCIVSYSDIFFQPNIVKQLINRKSLLSIAYDPKWLELWIKRFGDPLLDAETFKIDPNNFLMEIGKKPICVNEIQGQYMGLLRFSPEGWAEVLRVRELLTNRERDEIHMTGTLQKIIEREHVPILAIPNEGLWGEVDSIADLRLYV
jgi:choline kinase